MVGRIIETDADVAEGAAHLAAVEPRFGRALALTGPLPLRRRPDGFATLLLGDRQPAGLDRIGGGDLEPARGDRRHRAGRRCSALSDEDAARGGAVAPEGRLWPRRSRRRISTSWRCAACPMPRSSDSLVRIKGIGVWTAEIYAMFSLGRADVFAPGDLALQEAAARLFELPARPRERDLRAMARPGRRGASVAARLLWAYYRVGTGREGVR